MYGIINYCFELLFTSHYGAQCWERIKKDAGIQISGSFVQRAIYKDKSTFDILNSAVKILNVPSNVILEQFGRMFIVLSEETGDDMLLRALGENPKDFVQNLDTLHNHLATVYPEMRPPSFNCKEAEGGTLVIEYYSERVGLDHIVIGLIEEASERILKRPVKVELMEVKGALLDHTRFRVIPQGEWHETVAVVEHGGLADHQLTSLALPLLLFTMCPFHILFDRALRIQQVGQTLCRILGTRLHDCDLSKMFQMERPYIKLTIENILAHLNSVFVLCTTLPVIGIDGHQCKRVRLKGQMIYLTESNLVLYLSSPVVGSLDDLATRGLHLSDLKVYDPIRNLILLSEHFLVQYQITKSLEELTKQLQETNRALDKEKQMTDNLLYSVLPPKVADDLRNNRPVPARKYDPITLLFVGIAHFGHFCARHSTNAFKIVNLLNTLYTKFDAVIDRDCRVYKIETVADKYMAVSGLPTSCKTHAKAVAKLALDLMEIKHTIEDEDSRQVELTIGIHSGEVVAGVIGNRTPRFCLFGNIVNLTSRVETTALTNRVNISEDTYQWLTRCDHNFDRDFVFYYRGPVTVKGQVKPIRIWLLDRAGSAKPLPSLNVTQAQDK